MVVGEAEGSWHAAPQSGPLNGTANCPISWPGTAPRNGGPAGDPLLRATRDPPPAQLAGTGDAGRAVSWRRLLARNLSDSIDGFLLGKAHLVIDRDTKFTEAFRKTLAGAGVETVLTALRAPNMNVIAERFVKSIEDKCLSKMVFFGEGML